ncbi:Hypothetical protein CUL131002_1491c [Corynebacterium ulcerans]|nr:Hypothetical protein CUL131002_1491c [Corynebacterium ulcerans]
MQTIVAWRECLNGEPNLGVFVKLKKIVAVTLAASAGLALSACSSDDKGSSSSSSASKSTSSAASEAAPAELPSAEDLNAILAVATDPNAPVEEKVKTVQGGETAPELFQTMTASKQESGADFHVVPPILPGYTPNSVLATVNFTLPGKEAQPAENVEFIYDNGMWKLSQSWACTLITNTVAPEQVPPMCHDAAAQPPAPEAPAPAPEAPEAPAPAQ